MISKQRILVLFFVSLLFVSTFILVFDTTEVQGLESRIVDTIDTPGHVPRDLAWDGQYLWLTDAGTNRIYKLNPSTGEVVVSVESPVRFPLGVAWDGHYLWINLPNQLYKLDPSRLVGSKFVIVKRFKFPHAGFLEWDGQYLWFSHWSGKEVLRKIDPSNAEFVFTLVSPTQWVTGIAWDGQYLWCASPVDPSKIYQVNSSTGEEVESIDAPTLASGLPLGMAWDGQYLYVVDGNAPKIYKVDIQQQEPPFCLGTLSISIIIPVILIAIWKLRRRDQYDGIQENGV